MASECPECGFDNEPGAGICAVCRASIGPGRGPDPAPPPPTAPAPRAAPDLPPRPAPAPTRTADPQAGIVRDLQFRSEQHQEDTVQVCTFRVESQDARGAPLPPVPVELRGLSFRGTLADGDWVRLPRLPRSGRTLELSSVANLTTGARFDRRGTRLGRNLLKLVLALVMLVVFITIFLVMASAMEPPSL